jgi:hypothetical protein
LSKANRERERERERERGRKREREKERERERKGAVPELHPHLAVLTVGVQCGHQTICLSRMHLKKRRSG